MSLHFFEIYFILYFIKLSSGQILYLAVLHDLACVLFRFTRQLCFECASTVLFFPLGNNWIERRPWNDCEYKEWRTEYGTFGLSQFQELIMIIEVHVTQNGFYSKSLCSDYRIEKNDPKGTINLMFANVAVTAREAKTTLLVLNFVS